MNDNFIDSIPIGLAVFEIYPEHTKVMAINKQLVVFANQAHTYVNDKDVVWDVDKLTSVFERDIYAFSNVEDSYLVEEMVSEAKINGYGQAVFRLKGTEGKGTKWINSQCTCEQTGEDQYILYVLFQDCTKQVLYERQLEQKQESLEYISQYDSLTDVHNRYCYNLYLEQSKKNMLKNTGIIFADVNGLKTVNDNYGHNFGDKVILSFSQCLKKHFDHNQIYRISGDEFVVIIPDIHVNEFEEKVGKFMDEVNETDIASVGFMWQTNILDLRQEVYKAEQLMIIQKQKYYRSHTDKLSKHRPKLLNSLLDEIEREKYVMFLQPKARTNSSKVIGAEALIRKVDDNGKIILPYEFVPIFEKEMLIPIIDFFVLEQTCKTLERWKKEGKRLIRISVNMSRVSIAANDFIEHIMEICDQYDVDHQYLEFEITESTETKDDRKLYKMVKILHEKGFGISLDDMGSDYSSLKLLPMYGIGVVKLDRSFILKIKEEQGYILIKHIIAMCHELNQECIAEGVEDQEQLELLRDMGCDYYQGYLLDKPIPVDIFEKYLGKDA